MWVMCGFIISPVRGGISRGVLFNHKVLFPKDIEQLEELFPSHEIWDAKKHEYGSVYFPTRDQAMAFYRSLKDHYDRMKNDEAFNKYGVRARTGKSIAWGNLRSVFEELIVFFEKELGLPVTIELPAQYP